MATTPQGQAPGGLSWAGFKALSAETGQWLWGTVQGAFNEKASFSQIMVDAVIGMIPLVGDATAARDLIAVTIGLVDDPRKRESTWEWVLLVVLLFALIPVFGGVIKGAGRIVIKVAKEADVLSGAARAAHLQEGAREIIAFLNRIGSKNAEKWFLALRISDYQSRLLSHFNQLLETISGVLVGIRRQAGAWMPASLSRRIGALIHGVQTLKEKGAQKIPDAVKELDQRLREIQAYVRSGGETTSRVALHEVAVGERAVTRADEARLIENGPLPKRSRRGGFENNEANANDPGSCADVYKHEPGYPDLTAWPEDKTHALNDIIAFSGKIINRPLKKGEQLFRFFGPKGITYGTPIKPASAGGAWWGLGPPPRSAKEWREKAAVLDEFNRDGFLVVGTIPADNQVKAAVGTISEQLGKKIPGQYLPGGTIQAVINFSPEAKSQLITMGDRVIASGKAESWIDPISGIHFNIRPSGWEDANGIHGYIRMPGQGYVQTARLSSREIASKENREVAP